MATSNSEEQRIKNALKSFKPNQNEYESSFLIDGVAMSFQDLIDKLKDNIKKSKHGDDQGDSDLGSSVVTGAKFMGSKIIIEVKFSDYGLYVDKGTKPHFPPKDAIIEWIKRRPKMQRVVQEFKTKYKIEDFKKARESFAFVIARSIAKHGTIKRFGYRGSEWFTKEVKDNPNWKYILTKKISQALGKEVELNFKIIADEFKRKK